MTDYGHELLFGAVLTPTALAPAAALELAQLAEECGLDLVAVPDHPYRPALLDAWTVLSVIAARTRRIRVLPDVANLALRPPAGLARSAAALDVLSGGRVELGLGTGAYWDAIAAEGGPSRTPAEAVAALHEAIAVVRALWTPGPAVRLEGRHHHLDGAAPGPFPVRPVGIWVGALGPRMLRLVGQVADGWLPSATRVPPARLAAGNRIVDDAARAAGRDPAAVRRLYNITAGFPAGPPAAQAEQLAELTLTHGASGYLLAADDGDAVRRFAGEVAPRTRDLVTAERRRRTSG